MEKDEEQGTTRDFWKISAQDIEAMFGDTCDTLEGESTMSAPPTIAPSTAEDQVEEEEKGEEENGRSPTSANEEKETARGKATNQGEEEKGRRPADTIEEKESMRGKATNHEKRGQVFWPCRVGHIVGATASEYHRDATLADCELLLQSSILLREAISPCGDAFGHATSIYVPPSNRRTEDPFASAVQQVVVTILRETALLCMWGVFYQPPLAKQNSMKNDVISKCLQVLFDETERDSITEAVQWLLKNRLEQRVQTARGNNSREPSHNHVSPDDVAADPPSNRDQLLQWCVNMLSLPPQVVAVDIPSEPFKNAPKDWRQITNEQQQHEVPRIADARIPNAVFATNLRKIEYQTTAKLERCKRLRALSITALFGVTLMAAGLAFIIFKKGTPNDKANTTNGSGTKHKSNNNFFLSGKILLALGSLTSLLAGGCCDRSPVREERKENSVIQIFSDILGLIREVGDNDAVPTLRCTSKSPSKIVTVLLSFVSFFSALGIDTKSGCFLAWTLGVTAVFAVALTFDVWLEWRVCAAAMICKVLTDNLRRAGTSRDLFILKCLLDHNKKKMGQKLQQKTEDWAYASLRCLLQHHAWLGLDAAACVKVDVPKCVGFGFVNRPFGFAALPLDIMLSPTLSKGGINFNQPFEEYIEKMQHALEDVMSKPCKVRATIKDAVISVRNDKWHRKFALLLHNNCGGCRILRVGVHILSAHTGSELCEALVNAYILMDEDKIKFANDGRFVNVAPTICDAKAHNCVYGNTKLSGAFSRVWCITTQHLKNVRQGVFENRQLSGC